MIYEIGILLAILLIGISGVVFAYKYYKEKKAISIKEREVPEDVLEIFNKAEKEMKGGLSKDGTRKSPSEILWKIARGNGETEDEEDNGNPIGAEQTTDNRELSEEPERQSSIQTGVATSVDEDKHIVRKSGPNNFRRIISRIRGRK